MRRRLTKWGIVGKGFERKVSEIEKNLKSAAHKRFHRGLRGLGDMLGFETELPTSDAAPDCVWSLGRGLYIAHEAKSEHTPPDSIGANDVRQASSHRNWIKAERACENDTEIVCVISSPRTTVVGAAIPHGGDLWHVTPRQLTEIFDGVASVLRRVRSKMTTVTEEVVIEELLCELTGGGLTPEGIVARLKEQEVSAMRVQGEEGRLRAARTRVDGK